MTQFDRISKHLEVRQKYPATRRIFNSPLGRNVVIHGLCVWLLHLSISLEWGVQGCVCFLKERGLRQKPISDTESVLYRHLFPICISTQLSNDEALLGGQCWGAANFYRALPRTRGLDTKRNSIFGHGTVKWKSTVLWRVSRINIQRRKRRSKHRYGQFGLRWQRRCIRIYKILNNILKITQVFFIYIVLA